MTELAYTVSDVAERGAEDNLLTFVEDVQYEFVGGGAATNGY